MLFLNFEYLHVNFTFDVIYNNELLVKSLTMERKVDNRFSPWKATLTFHIKTISL
jgi:hypothetical protein